MYCASVNVRLIFTNQVNSKKYSYENQLIHQNIHTMIFCSAHHIMTHHPLHIQVSLSHGTAFIFDGHVTHDRFVKAVAFCMSRYVRALAFRGDRILLTRKCIVKWKVHAIKLTHLINLRYFMSFEYKSNDCSLTCLT